MEVADGQLLIKQHVVRGVLEWECGVWNDILEKSRSMNCLSPEFNQLAAVDHRASAIDDGTVETLSNTIAFVAVLVIR